MSVSIFSPIAKKTPAQSTNRDLGVSFYVTNDLQFKYPLVICYIAIENGPFIVDLPIKDSDFPRQTVSLPEGNGNIIE